VASCGPVGLLGVLGATGGGHLGVQQLADHAQPDGHAHGQQSLAGGHGRIGHGQAQLVGQPIQQGGVLALDQADR
jgi:hypothetical protein